MFNLARLIYIDPDRLEGATKVNVDSVDLYFRAKPKIDGNKSGIHAPGVELFITDVVNGVPDLSKYVGTTRISPNIARTEYSNINTSGDASLKTTFTWTTGPRLDSGKWYALIIKYDGDEDFIPWTAHTGDNLIGTTTKCPKITGNLFNYVNSANVTDYNESNWKPLPDTDLMFSFKAIDVFVDPEVPQVLSVIAQALPMEFVKYDRKTSSTTDLLYGDYVFEDRPSYPNEKTKCTCAVSNNSLFITGNSNFLEANGSNFNWRHLFNVSTQPEYIVVVSKNHSGAGKHKYAVRKVLNYYAANNVLKVDEAINFTNAVATFYKSPVARVMTRANTAHDGVITDLLILGDSNANSEVRFVNDAISMTSNIVSGGTGYANTDYIEITGFENVTNEVLGGYAAYANIKTDGSGVITNVFFSNTGCGFVDGLTYNIKANTGNPSSGTTANIEFTVGSKLLTEFGHGNIYFSNTTIINMDVAQVTPLIQLDNPTGVTYTVNFTTMYTVENSLNTVSGKKYLVDETAQATPINMTNQNTEYLNGNTPVIVSRSNQFVICYANGSIPNTSVLGTYDSNVATFNILATSNNSFTFADIGQYGISSYFAKYNINNDYTNEHTNYGNAIAKHITTKVELSQDQKAEDIMVYLTAFRPPNTDIKVYVRAHNSQDPESFDDKDWTLLEQVDGIGVYSNPTNQGDLVELTYNFSAYPNTALELDGMITTEVDNATIVGVNTTFTSDLSTNDLVKVYSPLFANTNYVIGVVDSITNDGEIVLTEPITNVSVTGSGLKIDRIAYPYQIFNNITTDNVARYYNSSMVEFDGFNSFQLKLVMLSPSEITVPKIGDCRAIAVSA